jgi:5-methylcytosine-specific restriction endonuclease McrA
MAGRAGGRLRDDKRLSASKRGYGIKWRAARESYLAKHPSCINVGQPGCTNDATCIDHIKDHRGSASLFWNRKNWQPMCHHCHSVKTATEMLRPVREPAFDASGRPTDPNHHWNA